MKDNPAQKLLKTFNKILKSKEIMSKILYSIGILVVFRILSSIPVVGIKGDAIKKLFEGSSFTEVAAMGSSSALEQASVIVIGLGPYINASVILQLLSTIIPKLEQLRKEGMQGRRVISMYTRYLTVPLAILQSFMIYSALRGIPDATGQPLIGDLSTLQLITMFSTLTAGSIFMMWLSELVSESALGGGSTLLIFYGIVSNIPYLFIRGTQYNDFWEIVMIVAIYIFLIAMVIYLSEAERKIKVMYSKRVRTGSVYESYIPLKLTQFGVMPVIFATSLFYFPRLIADFIRGQNFSDKANEIALWITQKSTDPWIQNIGLFVLIILFAFFYVTVVFNTEEYAENLQKSGAFIPGVRPGKATADYLRRAVYRLTAVGSVFLAFLAILPNLLTNVDFIKVSLVSGTGLLIAIGAVLEMKRQVESMVVVRGYDKYL
ncbi:preprotein translocase subunit SecY [Candidatus Dojkabacteria bacterium]|nr:preprotein translocase subunit SecY [Candidatus Dojkabacteria bacterium]